MTEVEVPPNANGKASDMTSNGSVPTAANRFWAREALRTMADEIERASGGSDKISTAAVVEKLRSAADDCMSADEVRGLAAMQVAAIAAVPDLGVDA